MPVTILPLVINFFDVAIRLQQGDTLSPILFVLVMNVLGKMISRAIETRKLEMT